MSKDVTVCAKDDGSGECEWVDEMTLWSVTSEEGGERTPIVVAVCACGNEQVVG